MTTNPFTIAYDALFGLAFRHPGMTALVRPGNRVSYGTPATKIADPVKENVAPADLPEIVLVTDGPSKLALQSDSTSCMVTRRYRFIISTGDFRLNEKLYRVEWMLFCAMVDWRAALAELTWLDQRFIKGMRATDAKEGFSDPEQNRGLQGWSSAWSCELDMYFRLADVKAQMET